MTSWKIHSLAYRCTQWAEFASTTIQVTKPLCLPRTIHYYLIFSVSHFTCLAHFIFKRAFKKAVWGELLNVPPDNDLRFHQTCFSATACGARGLRLLETQNAHARARMHIKWRDSGRLGAAKRIVIYCALIWMPSIVCGLRRVARWQ